MAQLDTAIINTWYKLPDEGIFRVISVEPDEDYIEIQFSDGTHEDIDMETWDKLGAEKTDPSEEWLEEIETDFNELDFYELGGAPGAEAFDISEYYD